MSRSRALFLIGAPLAALGMVFSCTSCGRNPASSQGNRLPDPTLARRAVELSLSAWREAPDLPLTSSPSPSIYFVDQQRRPGQPLEASTVLGESEAEGCLRFQVKLFLADPAESRIVAYYVFGEDPTWVYRSEDFEMIMHWDCQPLADRPSSTDSSTSADEPESDPHRHDHAPGSGR